MAPAPTIQTFKMLLRSVTRVVFYPLTRMLVLRPGSDNRLRTGPFPATIATVRRNISPTRSTFANGFCLGAIVIPRADCVRRDAGHERLLPFPRATGSPRLGGVP